MSLTQAIPTSNEEQVYRLQLIREDNIELIHTGTEEIICTICGIDLNWMVKSKKKMFYHPILEVLLCEQCNIFECNTNVGPSCLWCKKKEKILVKCSKCFRSLCTDCIKLNFGNYELMKVQIDPDWSCVVCHSEQIWPQRAICNVILRYTCGDN